MDFEPIRRLAVDRKVWGLVVAGIFIHVLLLMAATDVYFSSPIDNGMQSILATNSPPAKRLVLIVADGLRADSLYSAEEEQLFSKSWYLRQGHSAWGVSHTRVPTESRPGHVAMLAGIYEDPSAIFQGWAHNPVTFDSVINQSKGAYMWGSPDILNLFLQDHPPQVHAYTYNSNKQDFASSNSSSLDFWVFNRVRDFLQDVNKLNKNHVIYQECNLFFLHLLGMDTVGHGFKPNSKEYFTNLRIVDDHIPIIHQMFEETFKDNQTAYIFTSDHGMTDWGSHGSGLDHETRTPFIAWGAGIKNDDKRQDINQVDIAPLIAALIGINFPSNSVGILPVNYIDAPSSVVSEMLLSNFKQLREIFLVKQERIRDSTIRFVPFRDEFFWRKRDKKITGLYADRMYKELNKVLVQTMEELIRGADYYHNYYKRAVLIAVSAGFILWIVYLAFNTVSDGSLCQQHSKITFPIICGMFVTTILLSWQQSPFMYYLYFNFPLVMLIVLVQHQKHFGLVKNLLYRYMTRNTLNFIYPIIGIELMVAGFYYRPCYCLLVVLICIWALSSNTFSESFKKTKVTCFWIGICTVIGVFPALPVMQTKFNAWLFCGATSIYFSLVVMAAFTYSINDNHSKQAFKLMTYFLIIAFVYTFTVNINLIPHDSSLKYFAWIISSVPVFLIRYVNAKILPRSTAVFLAFGPYYVMMSTQIDLYFITFLILILYTWLYLEKSYESISGGYEDFRVGFFYMAFFFLSFFGTGNVASLNSFDPMWSRCFLTIFNPFLMTTLIVIKVIIPFLFVTTVFRAIHTLYCGNMLRRFAIVLLYSDIMLLQFLFQIRNTGSWLDIGMSFSHFIIMELFILIVLLLYGIVALLTMFETRYHGFESKKRLVF